jgi:predicted Zn-dependent protease
MSNRALTAAAAAAFFLIAGWPALSSAPAAQQSPLIGAMQDELKRSMAEMRVKGEPPPYYIEYEIDDTWSLRASARLGAVVEDLMSRGRSLRVQVRVGDYSFDSSRFVTMDRAGSGPSADATMSAPLDDNYDVIRRQLWLATDAAYKRAISIYAKKKAAFQNRSATDVLPDFSREPPVETDLPAAVAPLKSSEWAARARQISAAFTSESGIETGDAFLTDVRGTSYYLNSEGFKAVTPIAMAFMRVSAEAQAPDGMTVRDLFTIVENRLEDLPPMSDLLSRARRLAARVSEGRAAPIGEDFTGPILLEGTASAEVIRQALVPLMLARRPPDAENPRFAPGGQSTPFLTRIGLRVLSESFSASDTPSLKAFDGRPVAGAYAIDDEAVPAKDVRLVEKGRLLTLLTSRTPQKNLPRSNGHGRAGGAQAGVFQMQSLLAIPASELKAKYLELLKVQEKPFGYIVRAVAGPGDVQGTGPGGPVILEAVKVTPDGKEEPVRGLRLGGIPSTAFRDILEASKERTLFSYRLNFATAASVVVPNLIFEELDIQRTREIGQKPPVVPPPALN